MIRNLQRVFQSCKTYSCLSRKFYPSRLSFAKTLNTHFPMETVDIDGLRASVVKQGGIVRQLKKDGASQEEVTKGECCFISRCVLTSPSREGASGAQGEA